jgi:hypothetical protein
MESVCYLCGCLALILHSVPPFAEVVLHKREPLCCESCHPLHNILMSSIGDATGRRRQSFIFEDCSVETSLHYNYVTDFRLEKRDAVLFWTMKRRLCQELYSILNFYTHLWLLTTFLSSSVVRIFLPWFCYSSLLLNQTPFWQTFKSASLPQETRDRRSHLLPLPLIIVIRDL